MKINEFEYINRYYGLSIKKGTRVFYIPKNKTGTVAWGDGNYIYILWDGDLRPTGPYHPTSELVYIEEPKE